MSFRQWPAYQQQMYRNIKAKNKRREAKLSNKQRQQLFDAWEFETEKYVEFAGPSTDYPDELAEVLARQATLGAIEKNG